MVQKLMLIHILQTQLTPVQLLKILGPAYSFGVRPVVYLQSNIKLSYDSASGYTIIE